VARADLPNQIPEVGRQEKEEGFDVALLVALLVAL